MLPEAPTATVGLIVPQCMAVPSGAKYLLL